MKPSKFLAVLILTTALFSCDKSSTGPGNGDDPTPAFRVNFIIADSAGNNLLPYDLPNDPIVDPYSFKAGSDWNDSIGRYLRHPEYGFNFQMVVEYYEIMDNPGFQQDSTFNMYPCFDGQCDTVTIFQPVNYSECDAKAVYWGTDTTLNYECTLIPVQYEP